MTYLVGLILTYRYFILLPIAFFEGPITAFVVGALVSLGYFDVVPAYLVLVLGDFLPDAAYYYLGRYGRRRPFVQRALHKGDGLANHIEAARELWFSHTASTMFFSKLAYGLSTAFLILAGVVELPFTRYISHALVITLAQYAIFLGLGYYFSNAFGIVSASFAHLQMLIAGVAAFAIAYYFFIRYVRRKFSAREREAEAEEEATR